MIVVLQLWWGAFGDIRNVDSGTKCKQGLRQRETYA
jgi:hypothetical protein